MKPPPIKYQSLREQNICKHVCSSVRCLNNILHYQDQLQQQHQQQQQPLDPICEKQERFITTYKNPAYVKNILTCNPSINRRPETRKNLAASKSSSEFKENNPNLANSCSANSAKVHRVEMKRKLYQPRNNLNQVPDVKLKRFDRWRNDSLCSGNGGFKVAGDLSSYGGSNFSSNCEKRYIDELMTHARVDCPNVMYKDTENYKYQTPVQNLSNQSKFGPSRRHTFVENSNYCRIRVPVPSTFRPLDVTRISNYVCTTSSRNYTYHRLGQRFQADFRRYTSMARPLVMKHL